MNITRDAQIHQVNGATENEVDDFENGHGMGPQLNPMRPYLETGRHTIWNDDLAEMFVKHFEEEEEVSFTDKDKDMVEEMFLARIARLSRTWQDCQNLSQEAREDKRQRANELGRRNTRRVDVSYSFF